MAVTHRMAVRPGGTYPSEGLEGSEMQFCIGDKVREGFHIGTVTDVGTVLIRVQTATGVSRMVCPWDLVRLTDTAK